MCEMTGFTERAQRFASAVHADAATIAELNSLRRFAARCATGREVAEEIDARVVAKARRMGLAPDAMGDAIEDAAAARIDDGRELAALDEVRDAAGNRGTVAGKRGDSYIVIFDTPGGTRSLVRTREQLTLMHAATRGEPARRAIAELLDAAGKVQDTNRSDFVLARPDVSGLPEGERAPFLRGWDAAAEAVYRTGLRAAVALCNGGAA